VTPAQIIDLLATLHRIEDGVWWACVWLFCILAFKDYKGGK